VTYIGDPAECRTFVFEPLGDDVPAVADGAQPLAAEESAPGPEPVREEEFLVPTR
jgi:hypothetical protein